MAIVEAIKKGPVANSQPAMRPYEIPPYVLAGIAGGNSVEDFPPQSWEVPSDAQRDYLATLTRLTHAAQKLAIIHIIDTPSAIKVIGLELPNGSRPAVTFSVTRNPDGSPIRVTQVATAVAKQERRDQR